MRVERDFEMLVRTLTVERTRLAWLYAEALELARRGRHHPCDRLRSVEAVMQLSLAPARRKARLGLANDQEIAALDQGLGISREWLARGDTAALRSRILEFCVGDDAAEDVHQ